MGIKKNLVLGGSGAIGAALCLYLRSKKEDVINLDIKEGFDIRIESLNDFKQVDFVWFLAWEVGGAKYLNAEKNQLSIIRNNTLICQRVFSFLEDTRIPFMFTSSQLAANDNTYGMTKLLGEYWSNLLKGQIVRFWNVYGWEEPGEKSHVIPDLIMQAITKKRISLFTSGEEKRQFIYMDDCIKNLCLIRESGLKNVHLSSGKWVRIKDVAEIIGSLLKVPVEYGKTVGYQNSTDPEDTYKKFEYPTSLESGIRIIIEKTYDHLKLKV